MGFLTLGYGKLMAGKRVRDLQNRMMSVQSQMRRATREVAAMEKYINSQQRQMMNSIRMYSSMNSYGFQQATQLSLQDLHASIFKDFAGKDISSLKGDELKAYTNASSQYQMEAALINNQTGSVQQMMQTTMAQAQQQIEEQVEMMKQLQLEPLKDVEEDLQQEKDSLESQIQLAQQDYEACKEGEKASAKNLVPQYTGQG